MIYSICNTKPDCMGHTIVKVCIAIQRNYLIELAGEQISNQQNSGNFLNEHRSTRLRWLVWKSWTGALLDRR